MALVRRRFVAAIVIDAFFLALVVLAALVHTLASGHSDLDGRSAVEQLALHALHAPAGLVGLTAIVVPAASGPSATLAWLAPLAAVGDIAAATSQLRLAVECDAGTPNEYTLFSVLAVMLVLSALNLYWAARGERSTFVVCAERPTAIDERSRGFGSRRRGR